MDVVVQVLFLVLQAFARDLNCNLCCMWLCDRLCDSFYKNVIHPCCRCCCPCCYRDRKCCPCCCRDRKKTTATANPVHNMENASAMQNYTVVVLDEMPQPAPGYIAQQPQMLQTPQEKHQQPANSLTAKWPGANSGGADRSTRIASFR